MIRAISHPFRVLFVAFALCASIAGSALLYESSVQSGDFWDIRPTDEHISYIYAPGLWATEMVMGRYCPHFTAVTGEKFTFRKGGHVIGEPHTAVIFPEIDLRKPGYFTFNPITAYLNRIRNDLFPLLSRLFTEKYDFEVEDNPHSEFSVINYGYNFGQANAGQTKDIKAVHKTYQLHLKKYPHTNIVLYGDSRGSTTLFNFLAEYNPKNVKAAILESPYDDMDHYINHLFYIDKTEAAQERLHSLFSLMTGSYKRNGPCARKYAEIISDDVPLLLVGSLTDGLVAPQCVIYLYCRLKERGHTNVHILMLKNSSHPCYMLDNTEDKQLYEAVVHAFYKRYNLPHNSARAHAGYHEFQATQPSIQELAQRYLLPRCKKCF